MKNILRKLFAFILNPFEKGDEPFSYKKSNRIILLVVGLLFAGLGALVAFFSDHMNGYGFLIPVIIFGAVGLVSIIVGLLGSDRAVAKIWGNR